MIFTKVNKNIRLFLCLVLFGQCFLGVASADLASGDVVRDSNWMPPWRELTFQGSKALTRFLVRLRLDRASGVCPYPVEDLSEGFIQCPLARKDALVIWAETVTMSLIFPQEKYEHFVWFDPASLAAFQRVRWKKSGNLWIKLYKWQENGVARLAVRPKGGQEELPPYEWKRRYTSFYLFSDSSKCSKGKTISEPLVLVYLASWLGANCLKGPVSLCVFGKKVVHLCVLEKEREKNEKVRFILHEGDSQKKVKEKRRVIVYSLKASSSHSGKDGRKEPFSLLGLQQNIEIHVEADSGMPIRIRGDNEVLGHIDLYLVEVRKRDI